MFNQYPYINIEDLNLDYLMARMRNLEQIVKNFVALESVTFADPINWQITKQYAKNVVVLDENGNAFISKKAVPVGVGLDNEDYWLEIFNFMDYVKSFNSNLTFNIEANTNRASVAYSVDDWLLLDDVLYKVIVAIPVDGLFEVGVNIEHFTVEDFIKAWINYANGLIVQYKNDIDASEVAYRNQLALDIANTTASLQAQLNAAIAGATVDSEVIDARVGAFNETYSTLGEAIRTQIEAINKLTDGYHQEDVGLYNLPITWEMGYYSSAGVKNSSSGWIRSNKTYIASDRYSYIDLGSIPMKLTIIDVTDSTSSNEITANRYYSFNVGHEYAFNARRNDGGTPPPPTSSDGETISISFYPKYMVINETITPSNYGSILPDADDAPLNSIYRISFTAAGSTFPAHLPDMSVKKENGNFLAILSTLAQLKDNAYYCIQTLTMYDAIYTRYKYTMGGTWTAWKSSDDTLCHQFAQQISTSNYSSLIPDLDNADVNTYYLMNLTAGNQPANMPETLFNNSICLVFTYGNGSRRVQMYQNRGNLYFRNYVAGTWTAWRSVLRPRIYKVGSSPLDDYSSLTECIEDAIKFANSTIYVDTGTYDIISEYSTLHPDDWTTRNDGRGVNINNGLRIIFGSGAKVTANYSGSDSNVMTDFSAFNIRYSGAELINATIEASNIRYCVHDDFYTSATEYHNKYLNCKMSIDNSGNQYRSKYPHCIGGGFGQHGDVEIKDCIFKGIGGDGILNPAPDDDAIVSYHNGPNASQYSRLVMSGCYFEDNGTFRANSNGTEVIKSDLLISNNSLGSQIVEGYSSGANTPNMNVISFNNEVRN